MPPPSIRLLDLLACPDCHGPLQFDGRQLACRACGNHPLQDGVPRLLPRHERDLQIAHEAELTVRTEYPPGISAMIAALASDQIVLDLGAGERQTDDPRIVRADLRCSPRVDVVANALNLPLRDDSVDVVIAGSVFEHLQDPWLAVREIWRVLKPGGQVLVDCSFVFPFHGYPASYFHASAAGIRELFAGFRTIAIEVPPWSLPSYGLDAILGEWLMHCHPRSDHDREFLAALHALARFDKRSLDQCFDQWSAQRIAAGIAYLGLKQPRGDETVLPPPAMDLWRADPELQARYPEPWVLLPTLLADDPDCFLRWIRTEGRKRHPALARWYAERPTVTRKLC
jgi:uncharacterized protein YbaR (Trm112 family)